MPHRKSRNAGQRTHFLYSWHRWLGLSAAVFIVILAISGIALNHSERLGLDRAGLKAGFWQRIYGLDEAVDITAWQAGQQWVAYSEGRLYVDSRFVAKSPQPLGTIRSAGMLVVASPSELILLDQQGALLERIGADQLPGRIIGVTNRNGALLLQTPYALFLGNLDNLTWQLQTGAGTSSRLQMQAGSSLPESLHLAISQDVRSQRLTLERLLLDVHSGRLFGHLGRYVMDGAALAMLALALTGPWLWLRLRRRLRKRRIKSSD